MNFQNNVYEVIIDNFRFEMLNTANMRRIVYFLNSKFFYDNIAEFIDSTTPEGMNNNEISLLIKYKVILYNLSAFEKNYLKIDRMRKLKKLRW